MLVAVKEVRKLAESILLAHGVPASHAATQAGLGACDGLEMLLQQGMLCFERWTGEAPPWEAARTALLEAAGA